MEYSSAFCRAAVVVAFVAVGGLVATPSVTQADVTRIGTYLEVGNGGLGELHPDVAYSDRSNAYLVVWGDGAGGSQRPAFAQLVSSAGALVGPRLQLTSCGGELYGQRPRVTYTAGTSDDVFVVLYREWCGGAVNVFAHAVRYSANGAVSVARASVATSGSPGGIVYNAQRRELVAVWEDYGGAATEFDAYGRVLTLTRDGNGVVTGFAPFAPPIAVGQFAKTQGRPRIALDPDTQSYLIAFQGENPTTGAVALMYRTLDAASGALSGLLYAAQGSYNVESSVVYLPGPGEFLITWRQVSDIVGRRFAPVTGAPTSGTYPLLATPGTDGATGSAYDSHGRAGMVAGMNSDYTVWASEFTSTGAFVSAFRASTAPPTPPGGGTFFPQVTATGSGVLALTYGLDYKQVFIERFSANGGGGGGATAITAAKADFNGDLKADLLWRRNDGALSLWRMDGLVAAQQIALDPAIVAPVWKLVGTGDLDGNGKPEIIWQHLNDGWLSAWFMNGETLQQAVYLTPNRILSNLWRIVAVADMNGDNKADLIWQHDHGWLAVWYMNGTTLSSDEYLTPNSVAGNDWKVVGAGDMNGDLKPDLIWQHTSGGWLSAWLMNGATMTSAVYLTPNRIAGSDWKIRGVIDLDGDGQTDLVWQHESGGWIAAWLMSGITATSTPYLVPNSVDTSWRLVGPK